MSGARVCIGRRRVDVKGNAGAQMGWKGVEGEDLKNVLRVF